MQSYNHNSLFYPPSSPPVSSIATKQEYEERKGLKCPNEMIDSIHNVARDFGHKLM
jgi:hypothetical protein